MMELRFGFSVGSLNSNLYPMTASLFPGFCDMLFTFFNDNDNYSCCDDFVVAKFGGAAN